jgi:hypothetical protein
MKWSTLCIFALGVPALGVQALAQTAADSYRNVAVAYFNGNGASVLFLAPAPASAASAASASQSMADNATPLDEIARRLIRKRVEWPDKYPSRVTFTSVEVNSQGTDNYLVSAKYTVRAYYTARTHALDYDHRFLLFNQAGSWKLQSVSFTHPTPGRDEAAATPPPPGVTDVPAPGNVASASSPTPAVAKPPQNTAPQAQPHPSASAPAAKTTQSGSGGAVPAKEYHCVFFVGDHLQDVAPFTITGNSTYTDSEGKRGTYSFTAASSTLTFHGGNYDGQRATYETSGGQPQIHILGPSGRAVIDCD